MVEINFLNKVKQIIRSGAIFIVRIYQVLFSRLLGGCNCRFEPSCSQYMIDAIEKKGVIHGIYLGIKRLLSCHPFSKKSGFDPVK